MTAKSTVKKQKARQLKLLIIIALVVLPIPEFYVLYKKGFFHDFGAIPFIYVIGILCFAYFVIVRFLGITKYRKKSNYKAMQVSAAIAIGAWVVIFLIPIIKQIYYSFFN